LGTFFYQAVRARAGDRCARAQEDERCFVRGLPYGGTHDGEACLLNLHLVQEFLAQHAPGTEVYLVSVVFAVLRENESARERKRESAHARERESGEKESEERARDRKRVIFRFTF
jgi:hypothetical protein